MKRFLLDTNLLLGFVRQAPWAIQARAEFNLADPDVMVYTSVICQGEILALAEKNGWGSTRRTRLDKVLDEVPTLGIGNRRILEAYARIDAWTHGNPVNSPRNAPPPRQAVPMKQNDIWVAATAHASGSALLSTDKDFAHLDDVWFDFTWIDQSVAFCRTDRASAGAAARKQAASRRRRTSPTSPPRRPPPPRAIRPGCCTARSCPRGRRTRRAAPSCATWGGIPSTAASRRSDR